MTDTDDIDDAEYAAVLGLLIPNKTTIYPTQESNWAEAMLIGFMNGHAVMQMMKNKDSVQGWWEMRDVDSLISSISSGEFQLSPPE